MNALMTIRECSFSYGEGRFRLTDVDLDVSEGEMLGIVGPNGSGKSTLLRLMSGLLKPESGRIELRGTELGAVGRKYLATELALLPQTPPSSFEFSVREVVSMGRYPYQGAFGFLTESDTKIVDNALEETGTRELAERYFSTLSGGERQSVLVASILAQQPSLMLLDEPTASLDIHHRSEVMDLLWSLARRDLGVAVVTHDLNAAGQFCDRLALLNDGELVRTGNPEEVLDEDLLAEVYGTSVRVMPNPATNAPMVIVPGKEAHEVE